MAVTFLVSKWPYLNSQRLYRQISRTFSQVTFGAFMTLESRKKSSHQCVLGIFGINQGPNFHKPDTYSTWTAHPSRLLGCAVPCRPLASFAESSWDNRRVLHTNITNIHPSPTRERWCSPRILSAGQWLPIYNTNTRVSVYYL